MQEAYITGIYSRVYKSLSRVVVTQMESPSPKLVNPRRRKRRGRQTTTFETRAHKHVNDAGAIPRPEAKALAIQSNR